MRWTLSLPTRRFGGAFALAALGVLGLSTPRQAHGQTVAQVQVTPERVTLAPGQRQALFAAAYDRQGNLVARARITFRSTDTTVARVGRDGVVVGLRPGSASVEARVQNRSAGVAVRVTGTARGTGSAEAGRPRADSVLTRSSAPVPAVTSTATVLTLDPPSAYLLPSEPLRLTPRALRDDGTPADPVRVTWKSLRPEIATVDAEGLVVGVAPGQAIVKAEGSGGLAATAAISIAAAEWTIAPARLLLAPGGVDTLRAMVPAQGGREVRGGLVWRSSDTTVARVGPTGIVVGLAPGETEIVASGFFQERRVTVRVHKLPVALVVSPHLGSALQLPVHASQPVSAFAEAADSTRIAEARIDWAVADTTVARYDTMTGTLVGVAQGATTLTARLTGFDPVTWPVRVIPGRIVLDRTRAAVGVGERLALVPRIVDDSGHGLGPVGDGVRWTSSRPEVAAADTAGVVVGTGLGRATLRATTSWGQSTEAEIFGVGDLLVSSNRAAREGAPWWAVYTLRLAAPDALTPVYADSATAVQAVFSPDRTRIAFSSNKGGAFNLWVMDADGRNAQRVTTGAGADGEPAWTPDGQRLVFSSTRGGTQQIYSVRLDGSDLRALTTAGANSSPAVSPDGRTIAFVSTRDGNADVWLMDVDGGNPRRLAATPEREEQPRWFANGDVAYVLARKDGGHLMRRAPSASAAAPVLVAPEAIVSYALARDGRRVVYVLAHGAGRAASYRLMVQDLAAAGAVPAAVPLRPGEQVVSPSF